jgi:HK97 family phage major capsid protein
VLSSVGDIVLADFSQYALGLRADASIVRDDSVFFASDECAFRLILRLDGQPMHSTPLKLRDGTNTVSPFVTLEAR